MSLASPPPPISDASVRAATLATPVRRRLVHPAVVVVIGLAVVLVLVVFGALYQLRSDAIAAQHRALGTLATALADELDRGLQGVVLALDTTRDGLRAQAPALPAPTSAMLRERAALLPLVADFWTLDRAGRVTSASTVAPPPAFDSFLPHPESLLPVAGRSIAISKPFAVEGRDEVALLTALTDHGGQVVGWLLAGIPTREWEGAFAVARPAADATLLVLRSDDALLAGPPAAVPALKPARRSFIEKVAGVDGFVEVQPLRHFPVRVLVMRDTSALLGNWRSLAEVVVFGLVVTLLVLAALLFGLLRSERARERAEAAWQSDQARAALAAAAAQEGYWEWRPHDDALYLSPRMLELLDVPSTNAVQTMAALVARVHPADALAFDAAMRPVDEGEPGMTRIAPAGTAIDLAVRLRQSIDGGSTADRVGWAPVAEANGNPGAHIDPDTDARARPLAAPAPSRSTTSTTPTEMAAEWRWVRFRGNAALGADARVAQVAGVAFDITDERERAAQTQRLEAQLVQSRKLEALGNLAGGVAHDFNNVLAAVIGYAELAQQSAPAGSVLNGQLDRVVQAGLRGKAVVARILSFSRGASPRTESVFAIQPLVRQVIDLLRPNVPMNVSVKVTGADEPLYTRGDATLCFESVMNLCTNALQAMPHGGALEVSVASSQLSEGRLISDGVLLPGAYVTVEVSDTGVGIEPAVMERLFEPFFTTRGQHGTGLGLSVVRGVVDEVGGAIDVWSEPGRGSRFSLYLRESTTPADEDIEDDDLPPGDGQVVLVVDDDAALVALTEETLARLGYEPVGFTDARLAVEAFAESPARFDAVLSDELMPGMTGTQLASALHAIRPDVPVLLVSGFGGAGLQSRAAEADVRLVLAKPLARRELSRALAQVFAADSRQTVSDRL